MRQPAPEITKHPLMGVQLSNLWTVMKEHGGLGKNFNRFTLLFMLSALSRAPFTFMDRVLVRMNHPLPGPEKPVIIVGYWRSGTTHLHNLLSQNSEFGIITPIASGVPGELLTLGTWFQGLLKQALPENREVDNVAVTINSPQEDEIPVANLQPLSVYHALYFPESFKETFSRGVFFDGASEEKIEQWKETVKLFHNKIVLHQKNKNLLLKNPVYSYRLDHVLNIWPDARIIHIYRNPYDVFVSTRNYFGKMLKKLALEPYQDPDIENIVLKSYARIIPKLYQDSAELPDRQFIEVSFENLVSQPLEQLKIIYDQLQISGWEQASMSTQKYLRQISNYKMNRYRYRESDIRLVEDHWGAFVDRWDYRVPEQIS